MRSWQNGHWIEIASRNRFDSRSGFFIAKAHEAELIFDMITFTIIKNCYGSCDLTSQQAYDTLTECIEYADTRILLLVD